MSSNITNKCRGTVPHAEGACGSSSESGSASTERTILTLPDVVLDLVFNYLSFDEISKVRSVCVIFNRNGQRFLNRGFTRLQEYQKVLQKDIKSHLPRRESERHNHALSRHMEVLTSVGTRLCLLEMTYGKYVKNRACCFIPGKVLDEAYRLMSMIQRETQLPRSYDVIQELRDISGMAMEHFEEQVAPTLTITRIGNVPLSFLQSTAECEALRKATCQTVTNSSCTVYPSLSRSAPFPARQSLPTFRSSAAIGNGQQQQAVAGPSGIVRSYSMQNGVSVSPGNLKLTTDVSSLRNELNSTKHRLQKTSARCVKLRAEVHSHRYKWIKQMQQNADLKLKLAEQKRFSESLAGRLGHVESLLDPGSSGPGSSLPTSAVEASVAAASSGTWKAEPIVVTGYPVAAPTDHSKDTSSHQSLTLNKNGKRSSFGDGSSASDEDAKKNEESCEGVGSSQKQSKKRRYDTRRNSRE